MKFTPIFSFLLATSALAGEHTVTTEVFESSLSIDATFIPSQVTTFEIDSQEWSQFVIEDLTDHGTAVKKGDALITFERKDFDKALMEAKEAAKSRKIAMANTERALADLEVTTPRSLKGLQLAHDRAKESLEYFNKTGRALEEEEARERLDRATRSVSYAEEELKQLLKMYEEDGITEETEEIILKRQKSSVKSARFALKKAEQSTTWALEKTIPRQAVDLQRTFDAALLAFETGELTLKRALDEKRLSVAKAKRDDAEADKKLADLEADSQFLVVTAPADGVVFHGEIKDHSWSAAAASKFLVKHGTVPAKTVFMTLVPDGSPLTLHGTIGQKDRLNIPAESKGTASIEGIQDSAYPVEVSSLDHAPNLAGQYRIGLKVTLPDDSPIVTGMKANVKIITYRNEKAIVVPQSVVTTKDGKSTLKVKMADGKSEVREVKIGQQSNGKVEILEGLAVDQVVLTPEAE